MLDQPQRMTMMDERLLRLGDVPLAVSRPVPTEPDATVPAVERLDAVAALAVSA